MVTFWKEICDHDQNFTAWNKEDFGFCFEQIVIIFSTHIVLTIISAYHFGKVYYDNFNNYVYRLPRLLLLRILCSVGLMITPPVSCLLSWIYLKQTFSIVDIATVCSQCLCWLIHSFYVWKLKYLTWGTFRGPILNICSYGLTFIAMGFQFHSSILSLIHESDNLNLYDDVCNIIVFAFHIMYIVTLIPNTHLGVGVEILSRRININETDSQDSLLSEKSSVRSYGTVPLLKETRHGVDSASWLSRLTFYWVNPLMVKGAKHKIQTADDLYHLPNRLKTNDIEDKFSHTLDGFSKRISPENFNRSQSVCSDVDYKSDVCADDVAVVDGKERKTLLKALNKVFGCEYFSLGILKLMADLCGFAGPILLNLLVSYVENNKEPDVHGIYYAVGLLLSTFIGSLCSTQFDYNVQVIGCKIRCAVITTVYKKAVCVSSVSSSKFSTGEIVNLMSTDTDRVVNFCPSFHAFWSLPFQVGVSLYLLHMQVGLAFLAGLGFAILLIPVNKWLANKIGELSKEMMHQKDSRVKLMTEVLRGIRVVKFYAWEEIFRSKIEKAREAELKSLKGRKYLDALCVYFWATTPVLISILTFTTYSLLGNRLTAAKVFTSLSLFLMLISPLNAFPWVLNGLMEAWVSLARLQSFVSLSNLDMDQYYSKDYNRYNTDEVITIKSGMFSWQEEDIGPISRTLVLRNVNVVIEQGQFVGVVGKVGSGKSSLLSAILAEMHRMDGQISIKNINDGFAYVCQEPWIQQATIRDNILFGQRYDHAKYERVIDAAVLTEDLKIFPSGDKTMVGENGVTLSGGQKARVALARALYQDKAVYLLDDPLAAVDAYVAQQLFDKCIMGLLKKKTCILCTHHVKFLSTADVIISMEDGKISSIGTPADILDLEHMESDEKSEQAVKENDDENELDFEEQESELLAKEENESGALRLSVYSAYWKAVGVCLAPTVLIALFLMQASRNVNDWWLSYWVSHTKNTIDNSNCTNSSCDDIKFYLSVYGGLAAANSLFTLIRAFLFAYGGICAAQFLHKKLLAVILMAPISFFDTNPMGRIINRFSSDLYSIDDSLPFIMNIFLAQLYGILGTVVVICYGLPWFTLLLLPLAFVYYKIQHYYRHTSREVKRITSVTLSPIYAHFSETVTGLTTIRAFRETPRFRQENISRLDLNQRAQFAGQAVASWLGFRLQMMGVAMVAGIAFISVLQHHFQTVNAGLVGLALSYALSVTNLLSGVVSSFTETEKQLVSVERAQQYLNNIPAENLKGTLLVSKCWPSTGIIVFKSVHLRYRLDLPDALCGVSFCTKPAEKIGIVGRTGSGKSSLFLTLFRIVELYEGQIYVDDMNIKSLDLKDIRSRFAVIPQDPFLFSGSVRENLDPSCSIQDEEIWNALHRCHLTNAVLKLGGLESEVGERGKNFSVGQKQLVCLARAILSKAKVLCLDEATASVDMETDMLIQKTIRSEFIDSTVLTIAHRIDTIMDSDRVLVMKDGCVAEFDQPSVLLQDKDSLFSLLVKGKSYNDKSSTL